MKVSDLIKRLQKCNQDAEVFFLTNYEEQQLKKRIYVVVNKTFVRERDEDQQAEVELW